MAKTNFFNADNEHYKFLKYLTFYYNHITIIDAGTRFGESAFCLGLNRNNKIISYDINPVNPEYSKDFNNIQFKTMDINNETDAIIHSAFIIFLDIDPHDGNQEKIFYDRLLKINWSGYLICEDVKYSITMRASWKQVSLQKLLLQECGHWTGTGVIRFGEYITV